MAEPELPPKKDVAIALLEGPSVYVHLDPRREGVVVPKEFRGQPQLVLQIGLNLALRIPDLDVGDEGIGCTLSFSRRPFWCFMPWTAVYGLVGEDGRGMIWPEDVPSELAKRARPKLEAVSDEPKAIEAKPKRVPARARLEADDVEPPAKPEPADPEVEGKKKLPPYLRVIK